jgi:hypothetical protein
MLDPLQQAFETDMKAKARLRRPRPAARRADELDNLSAPGAQRLCQIIKSYWSAAGFANVQTEIVHSGGTGEAPVWGVRSDMIGGLPAATGGRNSHA